MALVVNDPSTASLRREMFDTLRHQLFEERIARQRAETRLADCQRQLADLRRQHDWDCGLYWTAEDDGPDLNKVIC